MVTIEDCVEAEEVVKADPGVRALLKDRYGLTDMALVAADPWYYGDRYGAHPFHTFHIHLVERSKNSNKCVCADVQLRRVNTPRGASFNASSMFAPARCMTITTPTPWTS